MAAVLLLTMDMFAIVGSRHLVAGMGMSVTLMLAVLVVIMCMVMVMPMMIIAMLAMVMVILMMMMIMPSVLLSVSVMMTVTAIMVLMPMMIMIMLAMIMVMPLIMHVVLVPVLMSMFMVMIAIMIVVMVMLHMRSSLKPVLAVVAVHERPAAGSLGHPVEQQLDQLRMEPEIACQNDLKLRMLRRKSGGHVFDALDQHPGKQKIRQDVNRLRAEPAAAVQSVFKGRLRHADKAAFRPFDRHLLPEQPGHLAEIAVGIAIAASPA